MIKRGLIALFCLLLVWPAQAEQIKLPSNMTVEQVPLQLNGTAIRSKFFLNIYLIGLYTTVKTTDASSIIRSTQPRRVFISVLRKVDSETMYTALLDGISHNVTRTQLAHFKPYLEQMHSFFKRTIVLQKGDTVLFDLIPDKGVRLSIRDQSHDIPSEDFAQAILMIWLGEHPIDKGVKSALLGGSQI